MTASENTVLGDCRGRFRALAVAGGWDDGGCVRGHELADGPNLEANGISALKRLQFLEYSLLSAWGVF